MVAGEHLIEHHRAAILIAARVNDTPGLFGRHIADRAANRYRLADASTRLQRASNTEIGNNQAMIFLMKQNIFWLNIAMDDRAWTSMGIMQRLSELMKIMQCFLSGKRTIGLSKAGAQRASGIERHHQKDAGAILPIIENGSDIRMIQRRGNTSLAQEMFALIGSRFTGQEDLNCDPAREIAVDATKNGGIATFTK